MLQACHAKTKSCAARAKLVLPGQVTRPSYPPAVSKQAPSHASHPKTRVSYPVKVPVGDCRPKHPRHWPSCPPELPTRHFGVCPTCLATPLTQKPELPGQSARFPRRLGPGVIGQKFRLRRLCIGQKIRLRRLCPGGAAGIRTAAKGRQRDAGGGRHT